MSSTWTHQTLHSTYIHMIDNTLHSVVYTLLYTSVLRSDVGVSIGAEAGPRQWQIPANCFPSISKHSKFTTYYPHAHIQLQIHKYTNSKNTPIHKFKNTQIQTNTTNWNCFPSICQQSKLKQLIANTQTLGLALD